MDSPPENATFLPHRRLGPIAAHVVMEESHSDQLVITEHPIEKGSPVADHAYRRPASVTLRLGWGGGTPPQEIYESLLALQNEREPFELVTGKRYYPSMILTSLAVTTDSASEHVLMATVTCQEVEIVETQTSQADEVENRGVKPARPA